MEFGSQDSPMNTRYLLEQCYAYRYFDVHWGPSSSVMSFWQMMSLYLCIFALFLFMPLLTFCIVAVFYVLFVSKSFLPLGIFFSICFCHHLQREFKKELNFKASGYLSLIALMGSLPDIVRIERPVPNGDWLLHEIRNGALDSMYLTALAGKSNFT